jgi:oligopeptide transport system ATP-binding protein
MRDAILAARGLSKSFDHPSAWDRVRPSSPGRRPALVDVSLTLQRGEILGVVGESGSGKTTLARCLLLLERPDSGSVIFDGRDMTTLDQRALQRLRRRVQIIFQDPYASLNPRLSVGMTLAEVLRVHKLVPKEDVTRRVGELLELVGLPPRAAARYPSEFSGGQRQRICIARALAAEPAVIVADEAVSALDVSIQAQVLNLLLALRDELNLAMIFISHDLHVVRRVAPRIAVMFGGRIVETLPPDLPLESARHPYTRALLAAVPRLAQAALPALEVTDMSGALPITGCPFRERCPHRFEPCETDDPPLTDTANGYAVACHYAHQHLGETGRDDGS